jgi:hypothetical protein
VIGTAGAAVQEDRHQTEESDYLGHLDVTKRRRVRVWFGEHVVEEYQAEAATADRYADAMAQRFRGLRVTVDDVGPDGLQPLSPERLWTIRP